MQSLMVDLGPESAISNAVRVGKEAIQLNKEMQTKLEETDRGLVKRKSGLPDLKSSTDVQSRDPSRCLNQGSRGTRRRSSD
jgi:hypothetical protein